MGFVKVYGNGGCSAVLQNHEGTVIYESFASCKSSSVTKACMKKYTLDLYLVPPHFIRKKNTE